MPEVGTVWTFDYTGAEQSFKVSRPGIYKLETWGAQGGSYSDIYYGGYGGYSLGNIQLKKNQELYVIIGGMGESNTDKELSNVVAGGYNGGASGNSTDSCGASSGGGGATHIATNKGLLSELENSKNNILIVAGGGGGAIDYYHTSDWHFHSNGGAGGGYISGLASGKQLVAGSSATQDSAGCVKQDDTKEIQCGTFGKAIQAIYANYPGGGGGYYGGSSGAAGGGTGGSGYIGNTLLYNKTMYCYNCEASSEESTKTISTTCTNKTPTENCSKQGNGYARITLISY